MKTLLLAEHENGKLNDATLKALSAARALGHPVAGIVLGEGAQQVAQELARFEGVAKVWFSAHAALQNQLAEPVAAVLFSLKDQARAFVAPATARGKNVLPRLAALLDVMLLSDVTKVVSADTFERPIYAGNAIETVRSLDATLVMTARTSAFAGAQVGGAQAPVEELSVPADLPQGARFVRADVTVSERPELPAARVVISGGRALASAEAFQSVLEPLADALGAAIGASRAAVDAGYAPNDWQVGQTGKVVAPDLYIAVGISGAIQHLAGMKDSKVIVAINKDADAPIFQVADFGLVGDLFTLVPELVAELKAQGLSAAA